MNTMVSRTLSVHKEHEVLLKLEAAGLNEELAQKIIDSKGNDLAAKAVRLIKNGGFESSTSQERARNIMGRNFFGVKESIKHFVNPSRANTTAMSKVPFTEEVLKLCKDTHILVAVLPISILDIRGKVDRKLFYSHKGSWYNQEDFAKDRGETDWHLVRKTPVPDSFSKNWDEQQALLDTSEKIPSARVLIYTIIGQYLATGERLFENIALRTSSVDSGGDHISVDSFDQYGIGIDAGWDGSYGHDLGMSSSHSYEHLP